MGKCGKKTEAMRGQTIRDSGYQPPRSVLSECTGQGKNWGQEWHRPISRVKVPSGCRVEPDRQQDHLAVETVTVKEQRRCLLWTQGNRYVIYCISDYTDAHELQPVKWQCQSLNPTENVQEGKLLKSLRVKKLTMKQRRRGKFHKKNLFQFCKSKNEKEPPWMIFTYSKTETRDTFIFSPEASAYLLLLSGFNVFPGFIWAASMSLWSACVTWFVNTHTLLWSTPFVSTLVVVLASCCYCNKWPQT